MQNKEYELLLLKRLETVEDLSITEIIKFFTDLEIKNPQRVSKGVFWSLVEQGKVKITNSWTLELCN